MTPLVPLAKTVNQVSIQILGANSRRIQVFISNESTGEQSVALSFVSPAIDGAGIILEPGGQYTLDESDGNLASKAIYAIANLADARLAIQEFEQ